MNAERLLEEFGRVSEAPDAVSRLREFIRDLAIEGQLLGLSARAEVACVQDVAVCRLGKMLDKAKNRGTMRRYLRNVNVRWQDFDLSDVKEMRFEEEELDEFALRAGDVLVCEGGEPNTRDFRCLRYSGTLPLFCSVSVFESVFVVAVVMHGHGSCPRVAAGVARGSTVRGPAGRGGSSFLACPCCGGRL